jgi:hypothetical protein
MRTLLKLIVLFSTIVIAFQLAAQDCEPYYIYTEGSVREMTSYDKKDKITGTSIQTVKEVSSSGNKTEWTINTILKDQKGKELTSGDLYMSCEEGIFKMDMQNFVNQEMMESFEGMEVTMDATDLYYPSDLSVGQTLKDGELTMKVSSQGVPVMTMIVKIYDRKVEAKEDVTTPAGNFSCYKMTYTVETNMMFTIITKATDWIAPKVGSVRSESYDKNGKLTGYSILTMLKE